ncbi:transglycosylase SLT domain-containing protein [Atopomonas sediminilitoris]|uniref:transglycosylase SLT domain-containing protein n=1 Tax=Atopomonas sediminilitoris TaxID=2919919 RepID=UPI001F4ED335|nr:transglycosylase SLT domain-containing protein [Atopomonas sediminilitoris]MCJ8169005.1 transglycosylase SLT domain-containing protein [Atopomonas sediminilitoris]
MIFSRFRFVLSVAAACCALSLTAQAANLSQQRVQYDQALNALERGDSAVYLRYQSNLRDYPLRPYLDYQQLTNRLKDASDSEVEAFLLEHGDLPQIAWLKLRWLRQLADRGQWPLFLKYYHPKLNFTELDCVHAEYLLKTTPSEGKQKAEQLWLVGKSQPNVCDGLFNNLKARGWLGDDLIWQRLRLAGDNGQFGLATYLSKQLNKPEDGLRLVDLAQNPRKLAKPSGLKTAREADAVGLGLRRLARQDPELALSLLNRYEGSLPFSVEEKTAIARSIGLTFAKRFDSRGLDVMSRFDPQLKDNTVSEWRARLLMRHGRWAELNQLLRQFPQDLAQTPRWRYWYARSLQSGNPQHPEALLKLGELAKERDFYGFLSADRVEKPYHLNNKPYPLKAQTISRVRNSAGIRRAMEFHSRGEIINGRREWYHVSTLFDKEELIAQARLGYELEWYFPAIRAISTAQYWDDLEVRFPMPYRSSFVNAARKHGLHPSWVVAVTRQESAFMNDARSGVGAMGLMQLMPATAKETAQRYGIPLSNVRNAYLPETNIQLGSAYLHQVLNQFKGNRVLASAAYNAGPGRVRQWLRGAEKLSFDVWVENIPFDETRQYVQNVLTYAVIYGDKLNAPQTLVEWHERYFDNVQ